MEKEAASGSGQEAADRTGDRFGRYFRKEAY